jgi:putative tryptophan/tyrosine transport system substrate-binding protein
MLNQKDSQGKHQKSWALLTYVIVIGLLLSGCGAMQPKVYHVGILSGSAFAAPIGEAFKAEMTKLGYTEGQNIVYDYHEVNNDPEGEKQVIKQFIADKVDLIFTYPAQPAIAAKMLTEGTDIPVVFSLTTVEGTDLIKSVSEPGGNITGVRTAGASNSIKRLEYLLQIAPQVKRVYFPFTKAVNSRVLETLRPAAAGMGVTIVEIEITSAAEIKADLEQRAQAEDIGIDAVLISPEGFIQSPEVFGAILQFANEHKLPVAGLVDFTADQGALFSYNFVMTEMGSLAAPAADKILKGTPAGTIPVVTCDDRLRINFKAAQALGLKVPDGLLKLASEIIR